MVGSLSHIRVLDMSRILAGPWASQVLADLGAEVIKIERPGSGDDTRGWGPPFLKDAQGNDTNNAAYFAAANRNKKSVTIDFTTTQGQDLIRQLACKSDIILENYKVGGLAKYGLDYEGIKAIKPDIIYCSITGFGQNGPYANRVGYDAAIQAMSGLMSITGNPDEKLGGKPMKVGFAVSDVLTGLYAAIGILAALTHKERTGQGQHIDLSLLDVQVAALANQALNYLSSGVAPVRQGNAHPNIVPYQAFATSDGHVMLAVGNDDQFARFCDIAGHPQLAKTLCYKTNAERVRNRAKLIPELQKIIAQHPTHWWSSQLEKAGIPCGPINTIDQVFEDPQIKHREMKISTEGENGRTIPGVACPIQLSQTPPSYHAPPPELGADTQSVLENLIGASQSDIDAWKKLGIT